MDPLFCFFPKDFPYSPTKLLLSLLAVPYGPPPLEGSFFTRLVTPAVRLLSPIRSSHIFHFHFPFGACLLESVNPPYGLSSYFLNCRLSSQERRFFCLFIRDASLLFPPPLPERLTTSASCILGLAYVLCFFFFNFGNYFPQDVFSPRTAASSWILSFNIALGQAGCLAIYDVSCEPPSRDQIKSGPMRIVPPVKAKSPVFLAFHVCWGGGQFIHGIPDFPTARTSLYLLLLLIREAWAVHCASLYFRRAFFFLCPPK